MSLRHINFENTKRTFFISLFCVIVVTASFYFLYSFLLTSYLILNEPYQLNWSEGYTLFFAKRAFQFLTLYPTHSQYPYFTNPYSPAFYVLGSVSFFLFESPVIALRFFNIFIEILIAAITFYLIFQETGNKKISVIFSCITLGFLSIHKFHGLIRVDTLGVFFTTAAIFFMLRFCKQNRMHNLYIFDILLILALLTKYIFVIYLAVTFVYGVILMSKDKNKGKRIIAHSVFVLTAFTLISIIINYSTKNEYLTQIIQPSLISTFSPSWAKYHINQFINAFWPLTLFLAYIFLFGKRHINIFFRLITITSIIWFAFAIFRYGADLNYSLEAVVFMIVTIGIWFANNISSNKNFKTWGVLTLYIIVVTFVVFYRGYFYSGLNSLKIKEERTYIDNLVKNSQGLLMVEEPFLAVKNNKEFIVTDFFVVALGTNKGLYDINPILSLIGEGKITRIFIGPILKTIPQINATIKESGYKKIYESKIEYDEYKWTVYERAN